MSETHTVHVANLASTTTEKNLSDFFTFCGKISSVDFVNTEPKSATIHFEKPSAAKTALMLNGGTLDGTNIVVTSEKDHEDPSDHGHGEHDPSVPFEQSDKPRAAIAAEYLAKGYTLSENILQKAIDIDAKQGISARFLSYIRSLDISLGKRLFGTSSQPTSPTSATQPTTTEKGKGVDTTGASTSTTHDGAPPYTETEGVARHPTISGKAVETVAGIREKARTMDEQNGYSKQAGDYYSKAISSPIGQKVFAFYSSTAKQVTDIHEEARRIADGHKSTAPPTA